MPTAPEIERVEWRSASAGELWVEVHGRWPGRPRGESPVLLIGLGARPLAFRARELRWGVEAEASGQGEGHAPGASGDHFRAGFAVPVRLRRQLGEQLGLRLGQHEIELPAARAAPLAGGPASPPNVVDPAVLAERRARRAELGEETLARRAAQAEAQVQDLEAQLDQLEHQLQDALAERERLTRDLSARERELRVVRQREYSEQQLRVEAEDQRQQAERQARLGVDGTRRQLAAAEGRIQELESELEGARRQVAEAEHAAEGPLRAELRRRQEIQDHVRSELEVMRQELARLQADARLEAERRAQAETVAAELERTVASLRDQLAVRERTLAEAEDLVAELRAQVADLMRTIEGERREHLDAERELRTQLEAQASAVQTTTAELRSELVRAAQELQERERREGELLELLADFVGTATSLRETFEREMAQAREELEARVAAERDSYTRQLSELEDRVLRLRAQVEDAAALSEELEVRSRSEAQAREALADAHAELRRLEHSETRARAELARLRAELNERIAAERTAPAQGAERIAAEASTPAPPPATGQTGETEAPGGETGAPERAPEEPRLRPSEAGEKPRIVAADLTEAFRRLRERAAEGAREFPPMPPATDWTVPPRPTERAPAPVGPPARPAGGSPDQPAAPDASRQPTEESEEPRTPPEPPSTPEPQTAPEPPATPPATPSRPTAGAPPRPSYQPGGESATAPAPTDRERDSQRGPWLTAAIVGMAGSDDPHAAARLFAELLPVQGLLVKRSLIYDLELEGAGRLRVTVGDGQASVRWLTPETEQAPAEVDFRLRGRLAALAPLVGGSAPRRLQGVEVTGRHRKLRQLLRRLRRPVTLTDLARAEVRPDPGLLLRAVVGGIDPQWTGDHEFAVVYAIESAGRGGQERRFHIEVHRGEPVRVIEGTDERGGELEVSAALRVPGPALVALLAGLPLPAGYRAEVEGDSGRIVLLGAWMERAEARSTRGR